MPRIGCSSIYNKWDVRKQYTEDDRCLYISFSFFLFIFDQNLAVLLLVAASLAALDTADAHFHKAIFFKGHHHPKGFIHHVSFVPSYHHHRPAPVVYVQPQPVYAPVYVHRAPVYSSYRAAPAPAHHTVSVPSYSVPSYGH
jgi:hypothetical protein